MSDVTWIEEVVLSGEVTFRMGKTPDGALVFEWPGEARLVQHGDTHRFETDAHVPADRAAKLARGPAYAVRRYLAGEMSLHASSVELDGKALVFLGPGGAGKSTLAARLCEVAGGRLLADDVLAVERSHDRLFALPTEGAHWLEVANEPVKRSRAAQQVASQPIPVAAIVLLDVNETVGPAQPIRVKGRAAMLALSQAHITLPVATPAQRRRDFEWLAEVCGTISIFRIRRTCGGGADDVVSSARKLVEEAP